MKYTVLSVMLILLISCGDKNATQISDLPFLYDQKIYKLVDNELMEVADLNSKEIRKIDVLKPKQRSLGKADLSFVKNGAQAELNALYRGNTLYYKLKIEGINDLKENFYPGKFTIEFEDEFGFILSFTEVLTSDLIGLVNSSGDVTAYIFNGKTEMSSDIISEIKSFSLTSTVKEK